MFQTPYQKKLSRVDHIWVEYKHGKIHGFKCLLCGGWTIKPPDYPTPFDWVPGVFLLPLTPEERERVQSPETRSKKKNPG